MKKLIFLLFMILVFLTGCGIVNPPIVNPLVDNEIVYRALLIGIGDYIGSDNDLASPPYSVDRMHKIFNQCRFGLSGIKFFIINELKDSNATEEAILNEIVYTFSGADNDDISYFYYTGHGHRWLGTSYLCPANATSSIFSLISVNKLENFLSAIPGIKVVILDTCHSGGFIGKGKNEILKEESIYFNSDIINIFSKIEPKSLLTTNQYRVLTSCYSYQKCAEIIPIIGEPLGAFTMALCEGSNNNYFADSNKDKKISLEEMYIFIKDWIQNNFGDLEQDVQVYPENSDYTIIEY